MENWINNKRGIIITKDRFISFNEEVDHSDNLKNIISTYYKDYDDYINSINVFNGPIIIANESDITILHTFGNQYQVYLPESLDRLNAYQQAELKELLNRVIEPESIAFASCPKLTEIDKPISMFKLGEILSTLKELENNIKR